jgi:hypothetical protein
MPNFKESGVEAITIVIDDCTIDPRVWPWSILVVIQIVLAFSGDRTLDSSIIDDAIPTSEKTRLGRVVAHGSLSLSRRSPVKSP